MPARRRRIGHVTCEKDPPTKRRFPDSTSDRTVPLVWRAVGASGLVIGKTQRLWTAGAKEQLPSPPTKTKLSETASDLTVPPPTCATKVGAKGRTLAVATSTAATL